MRKLLVVCAVALGIVTASHVAQAATVRMFIHHKVNDYTAWRKVYDGFGPTQKKLGVTAQAVYQSTDDPNDVTVTHDFKTVEAAKAFSASPELKEAMEKAGVAGEPTIWYTTPGAKVAKEKPMKAEAKKAPDSK